jgi:hypothetical protein
LFHFDRLHTFQNGNETNVPAKAMVRYKESFRCAHLIGAVDNIAVVSVDMIIVVVDAKKIARVCNYIINIYLYDRRIDGWMQKVLQIYSGDEFL